MQFSPQAIERIRTAVRKTESDSDATQPRDRQSATIVQVVKVTNTVATGGSFYSALFQQLDFSDGTWSDAGACWFCPINDSPVAERRYLARLWGHREGVGVFVGETGVTDLGACIGNQQEVIY